MFFIGFINAQSTVHSILLNKGNNEAIPYASILALKTFEGTITDFDGSFSLSTENENQLYVFQSLGYKTDTFSFLEIKTEKEIFLEVDNIELSEIKVYPKNAFKIVQKAVSKIKENYTAETMAQNVFYREEIIANNKLMSIKEANFNALSKYKNKENTNLISVNKARYFADMDTIKSFGKMVAKQLNNYDTAEIRKNAEQFFKMDFMLSENIGKSKTSLLGEKSIKFYKYNFNGTVSKDGYIAYHITFDQIDDLKKSLYKGHFYIDTASLAFIDIQIYTSPKGIEYQKYLSAPVKFIIKLLGFKVYIKGMDYRLHYVQKNNKWMLDEANTKLSAVISKKDISFDGFVRAKFKVFRFYSKENFYNKKSVYDKIDSDYSDFENDIFWRDLKYVKQ